MVYLVIFICVLNVALWAVFLIKFKKLFSTDQIIEKTRQQFNDLIKDIDKSADRDIYLAEESIKRIQAAVSDAEQKMQLFTEAASRLKDMIAEADKINKISNESNSFFQDFSKIPVAGKKSGKKIHSEPDNSLENKPKNSKLAAYLKNSALSPEPDVDPEAAFEINNLSSGDKASSPNQGGLFDEYSDAVTVNIGNQETQVTDDGAAYKEVPVISARILDEQPEKREELKYEEAPATTAEIKRRNLTKKVKELYDDGNSVEQIASKLSCSVTEIQFILDMIQ